MPQLNIESASPYIKKFYLPSTAKLPQEQQAWVSMDISPDTVGDLMAWSDEDSNTVARQMRILTRRIKEWNFVDQSGAPVPITFESVCHIPTIDLRYLREIPYERGPGDLSLEDKKK